MSKQLMVEDLKRSGLTAQDATKLGFKVLTEEQCKERTEKKSAGYLIPYYDINKKKQPFCRIRFLGEVKKGFGSKKPQRYWQPANTLPALYLPPTVQWSKIAADTGVEVVFTEGEKKAARACKDNIPTIGLGGVWSWRSKKQALPVIKDFDLFEWKGRKVLMAFDSDVTTNPMVVQALNALSKELTGRGATVYTVRLPAEEDAKVGLDDFLAEHGKKAFLNLPREEYVGSQELWKLNEELAFIQSVGAVYDIEHQVMYRSKQNLVSLAYADRNYQIQDGDKMKVVNAAEEWLKWPHRRRHRNLVYSPGDPTVLDNGDLNTWQGWGCEPEAGNIDPWLELVDYIFGDDPDFKDWFIKWLAYPLQNPGAKMYSAVLLISLAQGVGKSFLGYIMKDIYGSNFSVVGQDELQSSYNDWCVNRQFVMGEEIIGTNKRQDADRIKNMLTREQLMVSIKYQPGYQLRDCSNYILTSNHPDAMFLEAADRRIAVHEVLATPRAQSFYQRVHRWRENGGAKHLFAYLLEEVDCSDFNSKAPAIGSRAKAEMIDLSRSDLDIIAATLIDSPDLVLQMDGTPADRDLFTLDEIMMFVDPDGSKKTTKIAVSKALRRCGFRAYPVKTEHGVKKLWALRNRDKWAKSGHGALLAYYEKKVVFMADRKKQKKF